jgi:multicomponent K+:H+ antiporter subunit G
VTGAELPLWVTIPATFLLFVGGFLVLVAGIGLLRMPQFFMRMHPPTMGTTLGTGCILIASMLVSSALLGRPVIRELLITLFVIVTAPVTAMLLMRAGVYRKRVQDDRRQ